MAQNCFFCNTVFETGSRVPALDIFKTIVHPLERSTADLIGDLFEVKVAKNEVHSSLTCKSCFQLISEFAKLESRAAEIRTTLFESYTSTIQSLGVEEIEENDDVKANIKEILSSGGGTVKEYIIEADDGTVQESQMIVVSDVEGNEVEWTEVLEEEETEDGMLVERIEEGEVEELEEEYEDKPIYEQADLSQILEMKDNKHTCKLCPVGPDNIAFSVETSHINLMAVHIRHEHQIEVHLCDVCGVGYDEKAGLTEHMEEHVQEGVEISCKHCDRTFDNFRLLRIHERIHSSLKKGAWVCEVCKKHFPSRNLLEEHNNVHLGVRPYKCDKCPKAFTSKYTLKSHYKTHEERNRAFTCGVCAKSFMTPATLLAHEKTHTASRTFCCPTCGKSFVSQRSLEVHSIVHSGERPYACSYCDKSFARKAEVKDHERIHTGERPFKCDMCQHAFSQRSNLLSHRRVTHYDERRYQCGECNKTFKRRRLLDYHVKAVHTHEKPYSCDVCDAAFIYPEHYKKHLRIHSGLKPFKCEVCDKGFNSKDNRNAHRFVHSDKKPYECSTCRAGFMRKPLLFNHMQQANHMHDTIVVNSPRIGMNGELVDESHLRSLEGWEDDNSQDISEAGEIVDYDGNVISINNLDDGDTMLATINEQGQLVNEDGQIISENATSLFVDDAANPLGEGEVKYVKLRTRATDKGDDTAETTIRIKDEPAN